MDEKVLEILRLYLSGEMDFDSLEDRVVVIAFAADDRGCQLVSIVYEVLAEIAYVKDRVLDEATFKTRMAGIVARQQVGVQPVSG